MSLRSRVTKRVLLPDGEPLYSESAIVVEIQDDAAGEFVEVTQKDAKFSVDPDEWPRLRAVLNRMIKECE